MGDMEYVGGLVLPPLDGLPRARVTCAIKKAIKKKIKDCRGSVTMLDMHSTHVKGLIAERKLAGQHLKESLSRRVRQVRKKDLKARMHLERIHEAEVMQRHVLDEERQATDLLTKHELRMSTVYNEEWMRARYWRVHIISVLFAQRVYAGLVKHCQKDRWRGGGGGVGSIAAVRAEVSSEDRLAGTASMLEAQEAESPRNSINPEKAHKQLKKMKQAERYRSQLSGDQLRAVSVICKYLWRWWEVTMPRRKQEAASILATFLTDIRSAAIIPKAATQYMHHIKRAQRYVRQYITMRYFRLHLMMRQWSCYENKMQENLRAERKVQEKRLADKYGIRNSDILLAPARKRRGKKKEEPKRRLEHDDYLLLIKLKKETPIIPKTMFLPLIENELVRNRRMYLSELATWKREMLLYHATMVHQQHLMQLESTIQAQPTPMKPVMRCLIDPARLSDLIRQCVKQIEDGIAAKMLRTMDRGPGKGSRGSFLPPLDQTGASQQTQKLEPLQDANDIVSAQEEGEKLRDLECEIRAVCV